MRDFIKNLTGKKIVLVVTAAVSLIAFLVITGVGAYMKNGLESQNMAKRWAADGGAAQISCFFSQGTSVTEDSINAFVHDLDAALTEQSITSDSENPSARLWANAYSTPGMLTIQNSSGKSMEINSIGVGGDFFMFHPLKLVSGAYFSGSDLMQDHIVIDEDAAWQLFGSSDVVGQQVSIGGIPHMISGVIEREKGRLNEKAGNAGSIAYVSYQTLYNTLTGQGTAVSINHYEIVMPNPVDDFAINLVKEKIGVEETQMELLENTTRFKLLPLFEVIGEFGTRSMNGKAIVYPYWENVARGYEDILAFMLVFRLLFILYPIVILIIWIVYLWKHRRWHFKDVKVFAVRKQEEWRDKRIRKKREKDKSDDFLED